MARNGRSGTLIAFIAACCLPGWLFCQNGSDSVDISLAEVCLEQAIALHGQGEDGKALELLEESISLSGRNSDALYLMSMIDGPGISPHYSLRTSRVSRLEASLAAGSFARFSFEDAVFALAECLISLKEYDRAARAIRDNLPNPELEARSAYALVVCDFFSEREKTFRDGMAAGMRRFPDDIRFPRFFLEHAKTETAAEDDRKIKDSISKRIEALASQDPEILVLIVPFTALKADRIRLIKRYRSLGMGGRRSIIESQRYGLEPEAGLLEEFWNGLGSGRKPEWREFEEFFGLLSVEANRAEFVKRFGAFSGEIAEDESGDGEAEGISRFRDGELEYWEYDPDQDGQADIAMEFKAGLPEKARCVQQGNPIVFLYAIYPELREAEYTRDGGSARLFFGAGGKSLPLVSFHLPFRAEGLTRIRKTQRDGRIAIPTFDAAIGMAVTLEEKRKETDGSGGLPHERRAVTDLSDGVPLRYREFLDGRPSLKREYENGLPSGEWFGYNEPGDFWEGRIFYEKTDAPPYFRKSRLSLDADGNGLVEYRESYSPVLRKEWDFDGNGSFDVAEESRDDRIIDYFSSKLNGDFDVTVEIRSGKIVSVRRSGKNYAVTKEKKAEIYWIGKKPFELDSAAPKEDGAYVRSGTRYIFYRSGKIAFAEVIP